MSVYVIGETLELLRRNVEQALQATEPRHKPWVSLSNVIDNSGAPYDGATNCLVMFLANITRENVISTYRPSVPSTDGQSYVAVAPPLRIVLHLAFMANFQNEHYPVGLNIISWTLSFFQQHPQFTQQSLPGLDPSIDQLTFELQSLDTTDLNYLMGLLGTKYLPTALYKVRLLTFDERVAQALIPRASGYRVPPNLDTPPDAA